MDWAAENQYPMEITEAQLAHTTGGATLRAYFRTNLLELRRQQLGLSRPAERGGAERRAHAVKPKLSCAAVPSS
jgi:hypothetical protein